MVHSTFQKVLHRIESVLDGFNFSSLLTLHLIHPDTAFVGGRLEDAVDAGDMGGGEGGG